MNSVVVDNHLLIIRLHTLVCVVTMYNEQGEELLDTELWLSRVRAGVIREEDGLWG